MSSLRPKYPVRIRAFFDCTFSFLAYNFFSDPNAQCTTYNYAFFAQNIADFPTIWQPALTLLPSDSAGLTLWNQISPGVPNIAPKGQLNGSIINETYGDAGDPDCCESHIVPSSRFRGSWGTRLELVVYGSCSLGHATDAGLSLTLPHGDLQDLVFILSFTDNLELVAHHLTVFF